MLSRAFDHICMEKARYKFLIIIIIIGLKIGFKNNFLNFGRPKTVFPLPKSPRDRERVKDQRKADDVM